MEEMLYHDVPCGLGGEELAGSARLPPERLLLPNGRGGKRQARNMTLWRRRACSNCCWNPSSFSPPELQARYHPSKRSPGKRSVASFSHSTSWVDSDR